MTNHSPFRNPQSAFRNGMFRNPHSAMEQLYRLTIALGATLDLAHETAAFMAWLTEAVKPGLAALFITDEAKQELRLAGALGFEPPAEPRLAMGLDLWRWLAEQGVAVPEEGDPRRYAVPIPIEQQLFGTLCLVSRQSAEQLAEEQRLVQTAAGYLAPVLRNIHRYQTLEQRVAERTAALTALNTVTSVVSQSLDLEETLAAALDATLQATGFEVGGIALWDEKQQHLHRVVTRGVEPELVAVFIGPPRIGGNRERLLRHGQPIFHDDTTHDPTVNPGIARAGFTISAMMPLVHAGKVLGILAVATRAPRRWTEEDKSLLTAVGQQIAVAVANAQLYEETQQSEEKYRSLVNTTNDLIFTVDVEGRILFANPAAKAFTGYEPEETIGHHFSEYVHPDDVSTLLAGVQQVLSGEPLESIRGVGQAIEYRMTRRDGQIVWVQTRAWPIRDAQGKIVGFSGITREVTERRQAEEALRQSEEQFRKVTEGALVGVYIIQDGKFRYVNPALSQMFKYAPNEIIDRLGPLELTHPDDRVTVAENIRRRLQGEVESIHYTFRGLCKDGAVIHCEVLGARSEYQGRPAIIGTILNITERMRTEQALRESEERFALAVQGANDGIWDWDLRTNALYWSPRMKELLGYAENELDVDFHTFESFLHPDDVEPTKAAIEAHLRERVPFNVEQRLRTKSGEYRWFNARGQALWDEDERPIRMVGSTTDITERKRAEEALRLRMEQLTALSRASQVVTASLDLDQVLAEIVSLASKVVASDYVSVALVDEAGHMSRSAENPPGIPALEYRARDEGFTSWIVRSRRAVVVDEIGEDGVVSPDPGEGAPRTANPYLVEAGVKSFVGLPLMVRDRLLGVLYLHSLRPGAFRDQLPLLTTFANQAAIAIENARLYSSLREINARLREALQAKDEMIQNVSHELRTPLALIHGYVQLMKDGVLGSLTAEQEGAVKVMYRQGERLAFMIDRLLMLQRIGSDVLQRVTLDLDLWLQQTVQPWEVRVAGTGIQLRLEVSSPLPPLQADPNFLGHVVENLLDNAVKFSPDGGMVQVRTWAERDQVIIAVSDQGIGIPPDKVERVFERFYQVDGSMSRRFGGMGIGLALCKAIVEAHGGWIWVESEGEGRGSTFYVALPAEATR